MQKVECPRCDGSGLYTGHGVCFRCNGAKVVNAIPAKAPKASPIPPTREELVCKVGAELVEAAESYCWD